MKLEFPDHYGHNLDALNDSLNAIDVPADSGTAIVFQRFDGFARHVPSVARAVLDIGERASRRGLLFGKRLLILVQTDDPQVDFGPLGANVASWNRREWLSANRGSDAAT